METSDVKQYTINMRSSANAVKGQGVGSAYDEQTAIIKAHLQNKFTVYENAKIQTDITHYHTINLSYYFSLPRVKKHSVTVGYVHFLPETFEQSLRLPGFAKAAFYKYLLSFYKSMDYLVTVNPYFIDRLEAYGVPRERVTYIPNYVDDRLFHPLPEAENAKTLAEYHLSPDRFTVVCAGQLQTRKGVFDFVECAKRLPEMQFVWAGGFPFGRMADGYAKIKKLLAAPPDNVRFVGTIDRTRMNALYNIGDVLFLPSYEELFPMTVLEAMSVHKPILLRDTPIYRNILFDWYLKANDVDGFVEQLRRLQADASLREQATENARNGHLFYNKAHVLQMWDAFYSGIVTDKRPDRLR